MVDGATSPRHWFDPVPARRVDLVRRLVFGYAAAWLIVRVAYLLDVAALPARRFEPVGVLAALDGPPARPFVVLLWAISLFACGATVAGRWVRISAPVGAIGMLVLATFTSSYGQVFHTEHLVVLHLLVLATAAAVEPSLEPDGDTSGWPLNLMMAITVLTYVLAGIAKLRWSGLSWVTGDILQNWIAIDNLRKLLFDDLYSPVGGWLSGIGWIWMPIALATLVVELGAPVALTTGRLRLAWLAAAWAFHIGVFALMAISFPYQLLGVAYAAFLPIERIADAATVRARRRRGAPASA